MAYTDIDKPSDYFNTVLYTGNGGTNAITGVGFQPDWIWFKNRTSAQSHAIVDSVRGREGLQSNATDEEYTFNSGEDFGTFDSDGFTVLVPQQLNSFNYNTGSIVSWNWKAGTSFTNDASATGIGTIDSTGSVNTDAGFSIISYTGTTSAGATVAHGLGVTPKMIIVKRLAGGSTNWGIYHEAMGNTAALFFTAGAKDTDVSYWNNTSPTSSVFTLGSSTLGNAANTYIAYCFAEKQGYSKFGSYTGNGNADGTFVYTGFKPAFILQKNTTTVGTGWSMIDNKRTPFNVSKGLLLANSNAVEDTSAAPSIDFLSNGFKWRTTDSWFNQSGVTNIYMAIAENPFVTSTAIPATAR